MDKKIISIKKYQNNKYISKFMLFIIILLCVIVASLFWKFHIENQEILEAPIPVSQNIAYNDSRIALVESADLANQIQNNSNKPVLIYFYTTWCSSCKKNFANFNEIAREYQNTDLKIIAVAIDKDSSQDNLVKFLANKGDIYFQPQILLSKNGFKEFLQNFNIKYRGRIPYTALLSAEGKLLVSYSGAKPTKKLAIAIRQQILTTEY